MPKILMEILVPGPDFFDKKHLPGKENEAGWARLYSSVEDYSRLLQMLACGGVYDGTRLMSSTTIDLMQHKWSHQRAASRLS